MVPVYTGDSQRSNVPGAKQYTMNDVTQALHSLGYPAFRPFQEEIVRDVLDRRDVLGLFATGARKISLFPPPLPCCLKV